MIQQQKDFRITSEGEVLIANTTNRFLSLDRTNASSGSGEFNINVESNSQATISYDDGSQIVIGTSSSPRSQAGFSEKLRLNSDGKLILSMTERSTPHGAQGDGAMFIEQSYDGNLYALMLRNKDTGTSAATALGFSLNRSGGDTDFESGKIAMVKEQAWTTSSSTVDSAMTFSTATNQILAERLRITSGGNIRIPFVDNGTGLRQKIQFVTEANYFDEVAYIATNRTAVSNAPTDMVFATGTTLGVSERVKIASNGSLRLTPEGSTANPNARIDTSGDNLRIVTMKDGSGGCGFIIETQTGGVVYERLRMDENGFFIHYATGNSTNFKI